MHAPGSHFKNAAAYQDGRCYPAAESKSAWEEWVMNWGFRVCGRGRQRVVIKGNGSADTLLHSVLAPTCSLASTQTFAMW